MTDSGTGFSIPLKGILKKGLSCDTEHSPDCPVRCQPYSTRLAHQNGFRSPINPLKGILRTSFGAAEEHKDCNGAKFLKRLRWDKDNIISTSCHSWLVSKPRSHLCSVIMLDEAPGTSTSRQQACLCVSQRKKTLSWNETSILATQHLCRMDNSVTRPSLSLQDGAGSHSCISHNEPAVSQPVQKQNSLQPQTPLSNQNQTQSQHIDITQDRRNQSQQDTEKLTSKRNIQSVYERPSFEELRKAHFREDRQALLGRWFLANDSDEEEEGNKVDTVDYIVPTITNCSCPSSSGWGQTPQLSNQTDSERQAAPSDP